MPDAAGTYKSITPSLSTRIASIPVIEYTTFFFEISSAIAFLLFFGDENTKAI
jgi:hypothetical protein